MKTRYKHFRRIWSKKWSVFKYDMKRELRIRKLRHLQMDVDTWSYANHVELCRLTESSQVIYNAQRVMDCKCKKDVTND